MLKYFSSIIVVLLCFIAAYRIIIPQNCGGMIDGFHLVVFGLLLIVFIASLFLFNLFKKFILKERFNYIPFITLFLVLSTIAGIEYFQSENFKSNRILEAENRNYHFIARLDNTYELTKMYVECTCTEKGSYVIKDDTLYLTERPEINITNYQNDVFLIDTLHGFLVPMYKDSIATDKNDFLCIL